MKLVWEMVGGLRIAPAMFTLNISFVSSSLVLLVSLVYIAKKVKVCVFRSFVMQAIC